MQNNSNDSVNVLEVKQINHTSDYNGDDVSCAGVCDGEIDYNMTGGSTFWLSN